MRVTRDEIRSGKYLLTPSTWSKFGSQFLYPTRERQGLIERAPVNHVIQNGIEVQYKDLPMEVQIVALPEGLFSIEGDDRVYTLSRSNTIIQVKRTVHTVDKKEAVSGNDH